MPRSDTVPILIESRVGLGVRPPVVWHYFAQVRARELAAFAASAGIRDKTAAEDEFIYQNSLRLNDRYFTRSTEIPCVPQLEQPDVDGKPG